MSTPHRTLRRLARISGVGLHSGQPVEVRLVPREKPGIVFARTDLPNALEMPANWRYITGTHHATKLSDGDVSVSTPEHLLGALWSLGISCCRIELNAPEVPILDGSALQWCELIQSVGVQTLDAPRPEYSLEGLVLIESRDGAVLGLPHSSLRATIDVDFKVPYLSTQVYAADVSPETFQSEIAPARTFTLEAWLEPLRAQGLIKGGSMDNALVLGADAPLSPLRFENELARHKALDLLGDVALLFAEDGAMFRGHLIAIRAGHELHRQWMEEVLRRQVLRRVT